VVSTYVERWNTLLGVTFVVVIMFMPYGLVPGCTQLGRRLRERAKSRTAGTDKPGTNKACGRQHGVGSGRMTAPALEITHLKKRFGGLPATKDVSLAVMPGERRLIIGPNGAGKTTLFNLITGDLTADEGSVRLFGHELIGMPTQTARASRPRPPYQISRCFRASGSFTTWCCRCWASTAGAGIPGSC